MSEHVDRPLQAEHAAAMLVSGERRNMPAIKDGEACVRPSEAPQFQSEEAAFSYAQRQKRIDDAVALRQPDHVPVMYNSAFWHATYAGISFRTAMYDYEATATALKKTVCDLQPDAVVSPFPNVALGRVLELAGFRPYQWPGHGLPDNRPYQYIDREYMSADEYDRFTAEPNWFLLTRYLPRVAEAYAPFAGMSALAGLPNVRLMTRTHRFARQEFGDAFARLIETGETDRDITRWAFLPLSLRKDELLGLIGRLIEREPVEPNDLFPGQQVGETAEHWPSMDGRAFPTLLNCQAEIFASTALGSRNT